VFNCAIFKELLKQIASCLQAKEIVSEILDKYMEAAIQDTALEASFAVF